MSLSSVPHPSALLSIPCKESVSLTKHRYMATRSIYKTFLSLRSYSLSAPRSHRHVSASRFVTLSGQSQSETIESEPLESQLTVKKIEDAIHGIIVRRSAPAWLPFVPGSSYWVPPRRASYGIAELIDKLSNNLTEEEVMSLTTNRGWPSSAFFLLDNETSPAEDEKK